jgi:hypothetical protein
MLDDSYTQDDFQLATVTVVLLVFFISANPDVLSKLTIGSQTNAGKRGAPNNSLDASGGSVFRKIIGPAQVL